MFVLLVVLQVLCFGGLVVVVDIGGLFYLVYFRLFAGTGVCAAWFIVFICLLCLGVSFVVG